MKTKIFLGVLSLCSVLTVFWIANSSADNAKVSLYSKDCNKTAANSCDFHGSGVYEIRDNFVYNKNTNAKTDGVLFENYSTLTTNSKSSYEYSYQDGVAVDHLIVKSAYSSNTDPATCTNPGYCDNLPMDEDKKLNFQFNVDIDRQYSDVRIKIDYLSTNQVGRSEINVVDFDSLRFYVYDENGFLVDSFKVDDTIYLGYMQRKKSTVDEYIGEDNYQLVSENIYKNSSLANKCISGCNLRVKVVPFDTYHNVNALFSMRGIDVDAYYESYQKETIAKMDAPNDVRSNIVNRMFNNAFIQYTPSQNFIPEGDDGADPNATPTNKTFVAGRDYYGLPYGATKIGSTEEFTSRIENGVYDADGGIYGLTCSTSVLDASSANLPFESDLDWAGKYFFNDEVEVVDCVTGCSEINREAMTGLTAAEIRNIVSSSEMYSRYANMQAGDVVVHKEVCPNSALCSPTGHARLVTDDPVVVHDARGNIDGANSYITTTEASSYSVYNPLSSYVTGQLDLTRPNVAEYLTEHQIDTDNYLSSRSQWRVSKKYTFEQLYYGEQQPNNTVYEQIYFPFTYKVYDDIAATGKIEKPYATMIYDDVRYTNYYDAANGETADYDKIATDSIEADQIVGTIKTNYKITSIRFDVGSGDNTTSKTIYPTYYANSPETRYSFYYDDGMDEVNELIDDSMESLTIYATVGGKSVKVLEWQKSSSSEDPNQGGSTDPGDDPNQGGSTDPGDDPNQGGSVNPNEEQGNNENTNTDQTSDDDSDNETETPAVPNTGKSSEKPNGTVHAGVAMIIVAGFVLTRRCRHKKVDFRR